MGVSHGDTYDRMKTNKGGKSMRVKITTTLRADLWKALQIDAVHAGRDANDILEDLIAAHLKKSQKRGERR